MTFQAGLPGFDDAPPLFRPQVLRGQAAAERYDLFFALFPSPHDAHRIASQAALHRDRHGLDGRCLAADRLHVSLHGLGEFTDGVPQHMVDAALSAAARVRHAALTVVFDRAGGFGRPFVLRADAQSGSAVESLHQALSIELKRAGMNARWTACAPHMTMLYDERAVEEHPIEPIRWTATRFALVLSHVGRHHHQWIGEWALPE